jgi:hypothetical protein
MAILQPIAADDPGDAVDQAKSTPLGRSKPTRKNCRGGEAQSRPGAQPAPLAAAGSTSEREPGEGDLRDELKADIDDWPSLPRRWCRTPVKAIARAPST